MFPDRVDTVVLGILLPPVVLVIVVFPTFVRLVTVNPFFVERIVYFVAITL